MKNPPPSCQPHRRRGVALVLVLCFVVLITGLVVAYFSRALTTRQLSNASTSTTQAEMLAGSATDVILSDFKTEIVNGSIAAAPPTAALPVGNTVYVPKQAAYAVPQRNALAAGTAAGVGPMPNLVRRSLRLDSPGGANAFPSPAPSPVAAPAPSSRASAAASDAPSINGRYISKARWNRHYLLPTANPAPSAAPGASPAPAIDPTTPVAEFTAPDWVFVTAEKGPSVLREPFKDSTGAAVTPTGRYAYAIYDEGGLLDINQTGYPSASTLGHIGAKPAPSYADLTQLPAPPSPNPAAITAASVDNLLGWRNYASLQSTSSFPTLQPATATADAAYYNLFTSNSGNLMQVPQTLWNNKTDQRFLSRQQLINYFAAVPLDARYLQYLGTFSRGLNQPSYLPEHSSTSINPSDTTRPQVRLVPGTTPAKGENDSYGITGINPNFLTARVTTAFKRYDTTDAIVGEPLVKKRFPLNRLAWLTYKGPSARRNTSATTLTGPDADIGYLKQNGVTKEWLDQGNDAAIQYYFGLTWDAKNKWTYNHGATGILNVSNATKPTDVARQNPGRDPDFFELLKASINPGSIAKASIDPGILNPATISYTHAPQNQYKHDSSLDTAILQIGANIIDQFDTDGFPTRINYNLGVGLSAVYGDENVPYISRVRSGLIHLVESDPLENQVNPGTDAAGKPKPLSNTGVAALMNYPEIWNLHDWSATNTTTLAQSMGAVIPKSFKVFMQTNDKDGFKQSDSVYVWDQAGHNSCDANQDPTKSPGFHSLYHFEFGTYGSKAGGEQRYLSELNTRMTFVVDPTLPLFREPTILYLPGIPTGSQLAAPFLVASPADNADGLGHLGLNSNFFAAGGGLKSSAAASTAYNKIPVSAPTVGYIGFYIGAHPLRFWWDDNGSSTTPTNSPAYQTQFGPINDVIYTLACEDGNGTGDYIEYDSKSLTTGSSADGVPIDGGGQPNANLQTAVDAGFGFNSTYALDYGTRYYQTIDPRTSRFGMLQPWVHDDKNSIPPRQGYSVINLAQGTIKPDREGANAGTALFMNYTSTPSFSSAMGWYPNGVLNSDNGFRPGLLTQNNPNANSDGVVIARAPGITPLPSSDGTASSAFYYSDPDGVVRRASAGNVDPGTGSGAAPAATVTGLPMAYAKGTTNGNSSGPPTSGSYPTVRQMDSRPSILNRPFRSVAELGYVYSGTPWKNLDFFLPESGDSAMLDVFCVNDNSDGNAMTAGQVNLNTHQVPVLQAILAQASKDQWNDSNAGFAIAGTSSGGQAQQLAQLLVNRTVVGPTSGPNANAGPQPLQNVSDLVGRWVKPVNASSGGIDGKASCDGFATDLATFLAATATTDLPMHNIQRFGESAVRALSNAGQTRVWNLMFDIVAQTGRYPKQATNLDQFSVEGEQHYWVHVAIDRYTGQILDKQVEVVKE